jgi:hypothetical protein
MSKMAWDAIHCIYKFLKVKGVVGTRHVNCSTPARKRHSTSNLNALRTLPLLAGLGIPTGCRRIRAEYEQDIRLFLQFWPFSTTSKYDR